MKFTVFYLLLLLCSVSTGQTTTEAEKEILAKQIALQQPCPQDVHAVLREMTASLTQLKVEMTYLQKENQAQAEKLKELDTLQTEINKLKQQQEGKQVAFSASLLATGDGYTGPFDTQTPLVYKHVVTNIGKAYNPNSGIFTAPVRGAYHFEWYVGTHGGSQPSGAVLIKNSDHIFLAYEHQSSGYGTSSEGVTLLLEPGDVVFVRLWAQTKVYDNQFHHITFSGHLIFTM